MFKITKKMQDNINKRKKDEIERTIGKITAFDNANNIYKKTVMFNEKWDIISFGWPCEYYFDDLIKNINNNKKATKFVIDIGGRNHKCIPGVYIPIEDIKHILKKAIHKRTDYFNNIKNGDKQCHK